MAILGDYDTALAEFKTIFSHIHTYSKKYNGTVLSSKAGGYSAKSNKATNSDSTDYYL